MKFSSIVLNPPLFYPPMKNEFRGGWERGEMETGSGRITFQIISFITRLPLQKSIDWFYALFNREIALVDDLIFILNKYILNNLEMFHFREFLKKIFDILLSGWKQFKKLFTEQFPIFFLSFFFIHLLKILIFFFTHLDYSIILLTS